MALGQRVGLGGSGYDAGAASGGQVDVEGFGVDRHLAPVDVFPGRRREGGAGRRIRDYLLCPPDERVAV
jgi:hypothetical protein